ncbi:MAG: DUF6076 domain-containing protein [Candidatus Heteroscillospira sp.]
MNRFIPEYRGRLVINEEKKREYFYLYQQSEGQPETFVCVQRDESAIGQHFLDFIRLNSLYLPGILERFQSLYDHYFFCSFDDSKQVQQAYESVLSIYHEVAELHLFWKPVLFGGQLLRDFQWYGFYLCKAYLQEDDNCFSHNDTPERLEHHWSTALKSWAYEIKFLHGYLTLSDSFQHAVSFCLDADHPAELRGLSAAKRLYIYQMHFDSVFLKGPPIRANYRVSTSADDETVGFSYHVNDLDTMGDASIPSLVINNLNYYEIATTRNHALDLAALAKKYRDCECTGVSILELLSMPQIHSVCVYSFRTLMRTNTKVRRCKNCGIYFAPLNRSDELYCRKLQSNGKPCSESDYESRISSDNLLRIYRTAYKTRNARKQRNLRNKHNADYEFRRWVAYARQQLHLAQDAHTGSAEFKGILDGDVPDSFVFDE